jgi:hypothetical protein
MFENSVPRNITGSKMNFVIGGRIKQHHEELHGLHSSPNIIEMKDLSTIR